MFPEAGGGLGGPPDRAQRAGPRRDPLDIPVTDDDGWPLEERGVVPSSPGLYFVGLAFQYAFASMLVGGAGRDAEYVVRHLAGDAVHHRPKAKVLA
ncbi:hypothetical protein [Streptomyces sp. NBC_01353]|uniref:hypothetical protein n=1 Tax=Streptomyces sp. NBC_01353 TaxID=2903835 RepID=UPI002E36F1EF|nr:hypothetical protein [Streptomyces sp. NBC_01353]